MIIQVLAAHKKKGGNQTIPVVPDSVRDPSLVDAARDEQQPRRLKAIAKTPNPSTREPPGPKMLVKPLQCWGLPFQLQPRGRPADA